MVYTLSPTPFAQKSWDQGRHRPSRDISTVIMPQTSKSFLLRDVKEYLDPFTARWYGQRGLPYRRGYLFFGPPGTGKTSLSLALAGELKVPLYILSLSTGSLTDETLTMLFLSLPKKCIVLLEDIDCAGVQRSNSHARLALSDSESSDESEDMSDSESRREDGDSGGKGSKSVKDSKSSSSSKNKSKDDSRNNNLGPMHRQPRASVSFSGLLNAIDGVASQEGRILIMTTNHKDRLDPALIRPGRVDVQIEFGYAGKETLVEIFRELYSRMEGQEGWKDLLDRDDPMSSSMGKVEKSEKSSTTLEQESEYGNNIDRMAKKFAEKIPEGVYTPAEVQGFLMSYKQHPEEALSEVDNWLRQKNGKGRALGESGRRRKRPAKRPQIKTRTSSESDQKSRAVKKVTVYLDRSLEVSPTDEKLQRLGDDGDRLESDSPNMDVKIRDDGSEKSEPISDTSSEVSSVKRLEWE